MILHDSKIKTSKNQLIDYAYDLKKKDSEGVTISNRGGWQSSGFNMDDKDDILQSFLMNCLDGFPNIKNSVNFKSPFLALNFASSSTRQFDKLVKNYKKIKIDNKFYSKVYKQKLKIELFFKRFYFGI